MADGFAIPIGRPALSTTLVLALVAVAGLVMPVLLLLGQPLVYLVVIPGIAVGLAILRTPRIGLYMTAIAIPIDVAGNVISITTTFNISIAWICTLLTLASWLANALLWRKPLRWPVEVSVQIAYLVVGILSLTSAQEFDRGVEEVVRVVQTTLFFLVVINLVETRKHLKTVLILLVVATVGTFAYALTQKFLPSNVIQERGLDLLKPGAVTYGVEMGKVDTHGFEQVERVTGTTVHAGVLALNVAYMLPFVMAYMRLRPGMLDQFAGWGAVLVSFAAFGTTLSRSGFLTLGFTILALVAVGLLEITGARLIAVAVLLLIGIPFVPDGYIERVLDPSSYMPSNSDSLNGRLEMWSAALQAIIEHPLRGLGIGNEHGLFDYWKPELRDQLGTVMNTFLQIPLEIGLFGLLLFVLFTILLFRHLFSARRLYEQRGERDMVVLGTAFLVLLSALVVSWMSVEFLRGGFKNIWLLLGCMVAYSYIARSAPPQPVPRSLGREPVRSMNASTYPEQEP